MDHLIKHQHAHNHNDQSDHGVMLSGSGTALKLGKLSGKVVTPSDTSPGFLAHDDGSQSQLSNLNDSRVSAQGLSNTRFHKGFHRKPVSNIANEVSSLEKSHSATKLEKIDRLSVARQDRLRSIDLRNGYNPITGELRADPPKFKNESIRIIPDGLGPEAPLRGQIMLRDSNNRFFTPHSTGPAHEYRQKLLVSEGLLREKKSGILTAEKGKLQSYGVEDSFSKSTYIPLSQAASTGLIEKTIPGRYTPNKQIDNPSGDATMKATWSRGVKL